MTTLSARTHTHTHKLNTFKNCCSRAVGVQYFHFEKSVVTVAQ